MSRLKHTLAARFPYRNNIHTAITFKGNINDSPAPLSVVRRDLFGGALEAFFDCARVDQPQSSENFLGALLGDQAGRLGRIGIRPPTLGGIALDPLSVKEKKYHQKIFHSSTACLDRLPIIDIQLADQAVMQGA